MGLGGLAVEGIADMLVVEDWGLDEGEAWLAPDMMGVLELDEGTANVTVGREFLRFPAAAAADSEERLKRSDRGEM